MYDYHIIIIAINVATYACPLSTLHFSNTILEFSLIYS